jgi:hypothetical protein
MTSRETQERRPSAVVWINERHATVARVRENDRISMAEIERGTDPEQEYLAHVVHELGEEERVMVVGPGSVRLALEREYVSIGHRPDRLVSVPPSARRSGAELVDRLARYAA